MLFAKDIKCSGKCLEKLWSIKIGIIILAVEPDCLALPRTVNVPKKEKKVMQQNELKN